MLTARQIDLEEAFTISRKKLESDNEKKEKLLKSQIKFAMMIAHHNIPSSFNTCFSDNIMELFPDSDIAKLWNTTEHGIRGTKGDYFISHGVAKYMKEELNEILRNSFSINFDESSINKRRELDINASFVNVKVKNGKIIKTSWRTLEVTGFTTAQDIVDAVYKSLEDAFIPKLNVVTITTDGCSTMLGHMNGVHAIMRRDMP